MHQTEVSEIMYSVEHKIVAVSNSNMHLTHGYGYTRLMGTPLQILFYSHYRGIS